MRPASRIVGVILAAGKGTRMEPFSSRYPKPILPICNKPLLVYQIESMKAVGIKEIIIVIGHLGFEITRTLGDGEKFGVHIRYVEQESTLGIAHAVGKLETLISTPFLLYLGDIFFVTRNLGTMLEMMATERAAAILAVKEEDDPQAIKRNFAINLAPDGTVKRVVEKPRYTQNKLKGCGLYLFDLPIFDAIRRTPRTAMRDEYEITDSIQILIEDYPPVKIAKVVDWDVNVTTPADLLRASLHCLQQTGRTELVGTGAAVHPGAKLANAIIGEGAVVRNPIVVRDSLLFPDAVLEAEYDVEGVIVSPERTIDCRGEIL